jgi:hypothetical protein
VTTVAVVAPVVVVVIVPPRLTPAVASTVIAAPTLRALSLGVRCSIAPDKLSASSVVWRTTNPPMILQKGEILHYLKMVA